MGNKMFIYATARGLAEQLAAQVVVPADLPLLQAFNLTATVIDSRQYRHLYKLNQMRLINGNVSENLLLITNFKIQRNLKKNTFKKIMLKLYLLNLQKLTCFQPSRLLLDMKKKSSKNYFLIQRFFYKQWMAFFNHSNTLRNTLVAIICFDFYHYF